MAVSLYKMEEKPDCFSVRKGEHMERVGFIGTGNMGGALVRAACKAYAPGSIRIANRTEAKSVALAKECIDDPLHKA